MMTEAEARKKRCCSPGSGNGPALWYCIASECMAWRWGSGEDGWTHVTPTGEKFCASTMESLKKAEAQGFTPLGYCGLAGKP